MKIAELLNPVDYFPNLPPAFDNSAFDDASTHDWAEEDYQAAITQGRRTFRAEKKRLVAWIQTIIPPPTGWVNPPSPFLVTSYPLVPNPSCDEPTVSVSETPTPPLALAAAATAPRTIPGYKPRYAHQDAPAVADVDLRTVKTMHPLPESTASILAGLYKYFDEHIPQLLSHAHDTPYTSCLVPVEMTLNKGTRVQCAGKVEAVVELEERMFDETGFAFVRAADHLSRRTYILAFVKDQVLLLDKKEEWARMKAAYDRVCQGTPLYGRALPMDPGAIATFTWR
ncbi:hypothetical protein C8J57DRAFT_1514610 [Mycena rebaudengoi]|nr:hypothetical protein C8J57DRAFT_1514610 [Mycena rebaudengoi]